MSTDEPTSSTSTARALADQVHALLLAGDPFEASMMGAPGHDADVPDVRRAAQDAQRDELLQLARAAEGLDAAAGPEAVTLATARHAVASAVDALDAATVEHVVSTMGPGPATALLVASQSGISGPAAAEDYLDRLRALPSYVDGCLERLREGAAQGRTPVAALVDVVLAQLGGYLASDPSSGGDPVTSVAPPEGWDGASAWRDEVHELARTVVRPAFGRYRDVVADELRPLSRADEACGLVHLPGGEEDYARLVRVHTTLPLDAAEIHATGQDAVEELAARMVELGARLGTVGLPEVLAGARSASAQRDAGEAMAAASAAVRRAEAAAPAWFPEPLPGPCTIEPMTEHLAAAGLPPMYFPPSPDGSRPGAYLFNALKPGAGAGWDLEATAYHEAVPGHHLQLSRAQLQLDLPALQRESNVTAYTEGWGLYAEHLAEDMGLYTSDLDRLGALAMRMTRAARLVVDTGMHALGWSRGRALAFFVEHVPLPEQFLESEINRYLGMPGQALSYYTGYREILRLRAAAEQELGAAYDVRGFHGAVLGTGAVPLPALATAVGTWVGSTTLRA
ncbi:uncharacterized protein (DUF885 family) [Motilibacter rhizosphaerae]|uniref:Uncharacterized protein (DUF885 family) n=1 Tax=Motilibacter rhizosphaerae TaxID=598652 RepID=A0A4Q7NPW4_9ACTN|nr:DUF885 domain-containing protein [Motilibacter rhizosphaerae]RZS87233.1 uncharacterized protein (DUF885 family) [Motilibacter rhizosphaerae]